MKMKQNGKTIYLTIHEHFFFEDQTPQKKINTHTPKKKDGGIPENVPLSLFFHHTIIPHPSLFFFECNH